MDDTWRLRSIPIVFLNIRAASKSSEQLRFIMNEVLKERKIVGSETFRMHAVTSDYEAAFKLACDLRTNYVGSVCCIVDRPAIYVNDVFEAGFPLKKYLYHVNKLTTYLNFHSMAKVLLKKKQVHSGVIYDQI